MDVSTKPTKPSFFTYLRSVLIIINEPPPEADILIVDAIFFKHTLHNPSNTYGKISEEILQKLAAWFPKFTLSVMCTNYCL